MEGGFFTTSTAWEAPPPFLTPQYIYPGYFLGLTVTPVMVGSSGQLTPPLSGSSTGQLLSLPKAQSSQGKEN